MRKALLLQFDSDPECDARRSSLQNIGARLVEAEPRWPVFFDVVRRERPDVIIIVCGTIPSHALEAARYLGDGFNTRDIPVVLVDVLARDVEKARTAAPRADMVERADLSVAAQRRLKVGPPSA